MIIISGDYDNIVKKYSKNSFEFELKYINDQVTADFTEIKRFLWESKSTLRFKNEYSGDALINLSKWNNKKDFELENDYFEAFLFFIKSKENSIKTTFMVQGALANALKAKLEEVFETLEVVKEAQEEKCAEKAEQKPRIGFYK